MSKKIISKIKRPHQKSCHRSSSVGNDSCLKDDLGDFSLSCHCNHREINTEESKDNLESQLKRLELINENLTKHLRNIGDNSSDESVDARHKNRNQNRKNFYLQPPGPLDDFEYLRCDLIDSTRVDHRKPVPKFRSTCYQQFNVNDIDYPKKLQLLNNPPSCFNHQF